MSLQSQPDSRIAQIDSLEAIINRLISDNNNVSNDDDGGDDCGGIMCGDDVDEDDELIGSSSQQQQQRAPRDFVLGSSNDSKVNLKRDSSTQTVSTGDIVITKVFDD